MSKVDIFRGACEFVGKDAFVHAGSIVGEVKDILKLFLYIVGIQHGQLTHLLQFRSKAQDIAVSPYHNPHIAAESMQLAYG